MSKSLPGMRTMTKNKNTRQLLKKFRTLLTLPIGFAILTSSALPVQSAMEQDDVGFYGSVSVQRCVTAAAKAMKAGQWGQAQTEWKKAIGFDPSQEDFYFALYHCSHKMNQWDQVALALEELFDKNPKYKDQMLLEYGECLFYQNRYDAAEAVLKQALAKVNEPSIVEAKLKRVMDKSIIVHKPEVGTIVAYKEPEKFVRPERKEKLDAAEVHEHTSRKSLTYLNAFMKCETIVIAEYKGYEHKGPVTFYRPPAAIFEVEERLKGAPINKTFQIKYEFHEKVGEEKPKDWKFDEETTMPKKGSKWIIFIPNTVAIDGMYETFHGSYGRQELNETNLDEIHKIIEEHEGQTK